MLIKILIIKPGLKQPSSDNDDDRCDDYDDDDDRDGYDSFSV